MPDAAAELVARHYSDRQGQSTQERKRSDILQLRELNNWVKSSLISQFTRPGDYVLDLACGKGGDLPKWKEAGVGFYCGVDIAVESVRKDARERYNRARYAFPAALLVADAFEAPLGRALQPHAPFDVVSCQFALHYAFSSERRARRALQNVAEALAPGGAFVGTTLDADVLVRKLRARPGMRIANQVFSCVFGPRFASKALDAGASPFGLEYRFTLADAVEDVPEYLVHRPTLMQLAREYGLHLVLWENFHHFVRNRLLRDCVAEDRAQWVSRGLGGVFDDATGRAHPEKCALSPEEWEVAHLYAVFAFRKEGVPEEGKQRARQERPRTLDFREVLGINAEGDVVELRA